jgi:hypothetical protein
LLAAVVCAQHPDHNEYAKTLDETGKLFGTRNFAGVIEKLGPLGETLPDSADVQHGLELAYYQQQNFPQAIRHVSLAMKNERAGSAAWRQTIEILGVATTMPETGGKPRRSWPRKARGRQKTPACSIR